MKTLQYIGANNTGFDKFLSLRFYKTFIRPIFEYGLPLLLTNKKQFKILEDAQNNCIRTVVNGHKTSSTHALKHMNKICDMEERWKLLQAKNLLRSIHLPPDSLLQLMIQQTLTTRDTLSGIDYQL